MSETTYVPLTPLPGNCILSFFDRPREMSALISHNQDVFRLIEHAHPAQYPQLLALWREPRETVGDSVWVSRTKKVIAMDEDDAGALWARWKEIVGYDSDDEDDDVEDEEWTFYPSDTTLHRRWSELERIRLESEQTGVSGQSPLGMQASPPQGRSSGSERGSTTGLTGVMGSSLSGIKEDEEDAYEDGERPIRMGMNTPTPTGT
jgi:hypothetical protein